MNKYFFQRAEFLTNLFDAIPSMLFIVDADVKVIHLNAAAKKVHGSRPEHIFLKSSGSVMNCIHAAEATGGCGTSSSCQGCVIRRSVREAAAGRKIQRHSTKME